MLLGQKVATVLILSNLSREHATRESLVEQADSALSLMAGDKMLLANAVLDSAAGEAVSALRREGWREDVIVATVERELQNARMLPTAKGRAFA